VSPVQAADSNDSLTGNSRPKAGARATIINTESDGNSND